VRGAADSRLKSDRRASEFARQPCLFGPEALHRFQGLIHLPAQPDGVDPASLRALSKVHRLWCHRRVRLDNGLRSEWDEFPSCNSRTRQADPDLAVVIDAWDQLPDAVRAGIMAMVRAASE
jgi:hypothetical protein